MTQKNMWKVVDRNRDREYSLFMVINNDYVKTGANHMTTAAAHDIASDIVYMDSPFAHDPLGLDMYTSDWHSTHDTMLLVTNVLAALIVALETPRPLAPLVRVACPRNLTGSEHCPCPDCR